MKASLLSQSLGEAKKKIFISIIQGCFLKDTLVHNKNIGLLILSSWRAGNLIGLKKIKRKRKKIREVTYIWYHDHDICASIIWCNWSKSHSTRKSLFHFWSWLFGKMNYWHIESESKGNHWKTEQDLYENQLDKEFGLYLMRLPEEVVIWSPFKEIHLSNINLEPVT